MKFGKKKKSSTTITTQGPSVKAALAQVQMVGREMSRASTLPANAAHVWLDQLAAPIQTFGVRPPYFKGLAHHLAFVEATDPDPEHVTAAREARTELDRGMARVAQLHGAGGPSGAKAHATSKSDKGAELARVAEAMPTAALAAQVKSLERLLTTTDETPKTGALRRELRGELAVLRRALARREKSDAKTKKSAPKAPKKAKVAKPGAKKSAPKAPKNAAGKATAKLTDRAVTKIARAIYAKTKDFQDVNEAIRQITGARTGSFDQETLTWTFDAPKTPKAPKAKL